MNPIIIEDHAREAMQMRRVSKDEVFETIRNPETTDYSSKGHKRYFKGKICVVTFQARTRIIVKTVLYRYGETWTDKDVRLRDLH